MHEEQDVRKMGGLRKYLPITHATFFIGWLAIIGIPPFAGFFSKDEILWQSFSSPLGNKVLWIFGVATAGMTSFYMTRLMCLTFWGKSRVPGDVHPHEAPAVMWVPLAVLAVFSTIGGWIGIPKVMLGGEENWLERWFHGVIVEVPESLGHAVHSHTLEWAAMGISLSLAVIMACLAYTFYVSNPSLPGRLAQKFHGTYRLIYNKYFVDEFYFSRIINPLIDASKGLWAYVDVNFIDRTTYVLGDVVRGVGSTAKSFQNGNLQQYAMYIAVGLAVTMFMILR
jgi:NADH-quinone oxidoreductase subunit L